MAMMASKGTVEPEDVPLDVPWGVGWSVRSVEEAEAPRRSPAERERREDEPPVVEVEDWI
jgi:hypothetical protein